MPQWIYYHLETLRAGYDTDLSGLKKGVDGRTYFFLNHTTGAYHRLRAKSQKDASGFGGLLLLNRQRDWATMFQIEAKRFLAGKNCNLYLEEVLAWDDDAGYLDLATEVLDKLGREGWELAGIDDYRYVFKKETEVRPAL